MNAIIFKILLGIVSLLGTAITSVLIPYLKSKVDINKLSKYKEWADIVVRCAEMVYTQANSGADKKDYAIKYLDGLINKNKIVLTEEQLHLLIEASVQALQNKES